MKFIVTATEEGKEEMFLFPSVIQHDIMAEAVCAMKDKNYGNWKRIRRKPVAAGFVSNGVCEGYSETLGMGSRPEDTGIFLKLSSENN